jgi:hypothetical protein
MMAEVRALFKNSSEGVLTFSLPFSTAVLNRNHVIEFVFISSCTLGVVAWFSLTEKGSNPATKADVSKTIMRLSGVFLRIFHPIPLNSTLLCSRW